MSQVELISRLLPSIEEVDEILRKIRVKYLIEEVRPENREHVKIVSQQLTSDEWEAVR